MVGPSRLNSIIDYGASILVVVVVVVVVVVDGAGVGRFFFKPTWSGHRRRC